MYRDLELHPLLTAGENKRYVGGNRNDIFFQERELLVTEMIGACKFNISKYSRRDKKQDESDNKKAEKYKNYLNVLNSLDLDKYQNSLVSFAFEDSGIKWNYAN